MSESNENDELEIAAALPDELIEGIHTELPAREKRPSGRQVVEVRVIIDAEFTAFEHNALSVNPYALNEECVQVVKEMGYLGVKWADFERRYEEAKFNLDNVLARVEISVRQGLLKKFDETYALELREYTDEVERITALEAAMEEKPKRGAGMKRPDPPKKGEVRESDVRAHVTTHPNVEEAQRAVIATKYASSRARAVLDAIKGKRDMVVTIAANERAERQGDVSLRNQPANGGGQRLPVQRPRDGGYGEQS